MHKKRVYDVVIPILGIVFFSWFIIYVLGSNTRCLFRYTTGVPCPGCGLSRSYTHLLHGNIVEAFHDHPLFIFPPVIIFALFFRKNKYINKIYTNDALWYGILVLFIVVYIIRMVLLFPHTEPMVFNSESLLAKAIEFIKGLSLSN